MFLREYDGIEVMRNFPEEKDMEEHPRDNVLFLTVADPFNGGKAV